MDQDEREDVPTASSQYAIQKALEDPIAFAASSNPDFLYWDQAMKARDRDKFIEAVDKELDDHEKMGNYKHIPLSNLPKGMKLINMVWSMRRKRRINTQQVYKWKARLNVHRGQQEHGVHYWDTYAPGGDLVDRPPVPNPIPPTWLSKSSTRFRYGIPSSASRDASLHAITPRIPAYRNVKKNACTETHK